MVTLTSLSGECIESAEVPLVVNRFSAKKYKRRNQKYYRENLPYLRVIDRFNKNPEQSGITPEEYKYACETIIANNRNYVIGLTKPFRGKGIPTYELIIEGLLGMAEGLKDLDLSKGFFATYIQYHIKKRLSDLFYTRKNESKPARLKKYISEKGDKIQAAIDAIKASGQELTDESIAKYVCEVFYPGDKRYHLKARHVRSYLDHQRKTCSINHRNRKGKLDIQDKNSKSPLEIMLQQEIPVILSQTISKTLDLREQEIIQLRYGLAGNSPKTLESIGKIMNLTRERIRQIEKEALCKLRRVLDPEYKVRS